MTALDTRASEIDSIISEAQTLLDLELNDLNTPEMVELKDSEPEAYLRELERVQGKANKLNKLKSQRQKEQQDKETKRVKAELQKLEQAIPTWLDPETKTKEASGAFKAMEEAGYSQEELADMSDHRMFVLARKAMLFDELSAQDLEAKKVTKPPKVVSAGAGKTNEQRGSDKVKAHRDTLRKTGRPQDAVKLFQSLLE